jgi:hypothetical protein
MRREYWPERACAGLLALCLGAALGAASATIAKADEGGISFWIPGFFGSLAATPQQAGFSFATIYYHESASAGGDVAFARQVSRGGLTANFTGGLSANLKADADLGVAIPSYVFAQQVLGGQAAVTMLIPTGHVRATVDATLTGSLGLGGPGFTVGGSRTDDVTGFGDLVPMASLRWNQGVHNFMTYIAGNLTVGAYDPTSLANLGIGHNAVDAGGGYTYFNPQTGNEFSGVLGFTYNFVNDHTQYQNGVDLHFDWGASKFLTKQWQIGLVGYAYQQLSCDSGAGDRVGCFESRVLGIGPQVGYVMPWGTDHQVYFNLKAYKEFDADHRADGWNAWFTVAISPAAAPPPAAKPLITK